jgi:hypothetical protein
MFGMKVFREEKFSNNISFSLARVLSPKFDITVEPKYRTRANIRLEQSYSGSIFGGTHFINYILYCYSFLFWIFKYLTILYFEPVILIAIVDIFLHPSGQLLIIGGRPVPILNKFGT